MVPLPLCLPRLVRDHDPAYARQEESNGTNCPAGFVLFEYRETSGPYMHENADALSRSGPTRRLKPTPFGPRSGAVPCAGDAEEACSPAAGARAGVWCSRG